MVHDERQVVNQIDAHGLVHRTRRTFNRGRLSDPRYSAACDSRIDVVSTLDPISCFQCLRLELAP
jgi:hypothetical protein